jgi:hypothetical protein
VYPNIYAGAPRTREEGEHPSRSFFIFFIAVTRRVDALKDGEQFHVSMLHVPQGPWQRARANSQQDV